jgi:ArsR family transcriptional regulator
MLAAARKRLGKMGNVEIRRGELEALPIQDGELNAAMLSLVLHHSPDPARTLSEAARVCGDGRRVLVVDMLRTTTTSIDSRWVTCGSASLNSRSRSFLTGAGFEDVRVRSLPVDPDARGPELFAAIASRGER